MTEYGKGQASHGRVWKSLEEVGLRLPSVKEVGFRRLGSNESGCCMLVLCQLTIPNSQSLSYAAISNYTIHLNMNDCVNQS